MLDVHPPHEAAHSWRDFIIHIATIVVGLLIAIGLEQSVEWIHHRNEVRETRHALAIERKLNGSIAVARTREFQRITPVMQRDLAIFTYLGKHPGAPPDQWPGKPSFTRYSLGFDDSAWQTALKSNVVAYMPHNEVADLTELYERMASSNKAGNLALDTFDEASSFAIREPDLSKLSPAMVERTTDALAKAFYLHWKDGSVLVNMSEHYPDFAAPKRAEMTALRGVTSPPEDIQATKDIQTERDRAKAEIQRENNE